ncbi:MAG: hypothetical protein ACOY93_17245 [Bacillota bacterium]
MRWYMVTLLVIAFLVGILFRATEVTGMRIWNMFATMGIFLFGLVGSLALARLQQSSGLKQLEAALKALEPEWVITDWFGREGEKPDYLLVGPDGITAVCVDQTPGSTFGWRARQLVERSCRRAERCADWVRTQLPQAGVAVDSPVRPLVLLSRRKALPEYSRDGVAVLNPDQLGGHLRASEGAPLIDQPTRFKLTRFFRTGKAAEERL